MRSSTWEWVDFFESKWLFIIQDYLSKYKTLRLLCEECKIKKEDKQCISHILSKLGPTYFVFVSTFYSMTESLTVARYQEPSQG